MWTRMVALVVALSGLGATQALAQQARDGSGVAGRDLVSLSVYGGGFSPADNLGPGADFNSSGTVGASATLWVHKYVGLRGSVLWAQTDVDGVSGTRLAGEDPDVWAYGGDVLVRLPFQVRNGLDSWFPYLVGGAGGKTYDFDRMDSETDFVGSFGGGVEYRFRRWGIQAEVRDLVSKFERFGFDKTQHDIVYTGGMTLSF